MAGLVDLRSDTMTQPTDAMRTAMAAAKVGDDVFGEDPTVNRLQERAAELCAKEAALFVPSGTMANLLAILSQTRPGDTVMLHVDSHPYQYESGGVAAVAGTLTRTLPGSLGILEAGTILQYANAGDDHHYSPTTLVSIENTTNRGGGNFYSLEQCERIQEAAQSVGMRVHCDGARLFNAVIASGNSVAEYASFSDTLSFCFSKGLGAPVGSVLVGDSETIRRAHRYRKMLGGGMRQAGILAAAALYALDHHVIRLAEDHQRAAHFRESLESSEGLVFPMPGPTNIVYIEVADAASFCEALKARSVLAIAMGPTLLRFVFHLDIDDAGTARAIEAVRAVKPSQGSGH